MMIDQSDRGCYTIYNITTKAIVTSTIYIFKLNSKPLLIFRVLPVYIMLRLTEVIYSRSICL